MKLAAQLYTVRDFTKTETDIYDTLKKIKDIGYDAVQLSGLGEYKPDTLKKMLDGLSLTVCATHTPLDRILNDTDKVIDEHKALGIKYIGLGWYCAENLGGYKKLLDDLNPAVEKIASAGLKFVYHNHAHEFIKFGGIRPLDFMRDNTDAGKFGFLADFYWIQTAGLSAEKFIADYRGRLNVVHFKDMRVVPKDSGASNMAEIFEGNMDYEGIYKACLDAHVEWAAVEQDICDGDPFVSLGISLKNLRARGLFI